MLYNTLCRTQVSYIWLMEITIHFAILSTKKIFPMQHLRNCKLCFYRISYCMILVFYCIDSLVACQQFALMVIACSMLQQIGHMQEICQKVFCFLYRLFEFNFLSGSQVDGIQYIPCLYKATFPLVSLSCLPNLMLALLCLG